MSEYNGWSNYATWVVKLWLDNEEYPYDTITERAREAWAESEDEDTEATPGSLTRVEVASRTMSRGLREWVEDEFTLPTDGLAGDLMGSALDDVDWDEIATAYIEDVKEEED